MSRVKVSALSCALMAVVSGSAQAASNRVTVVDMATGQTLVNGCTSQAVSVLPNKISISLDNTACDSSSSSSTSSSSTSSSSTSSTASSTSSSSGSAGTVPVYASGCGPNILASRCLTGLAGGKSLYIPGGTSSYSFKDGEVYAVRFNYTGAAGGFAITQTGTSIPGEYGTLYDGVLSAIPGSFTTTVDQAGKPVPLPRNCGFYLNGGSEIKANRYDVAASNQCKLIPGYVYYWNVRLSQSGTGCGANGRWCVRRVVSSIPIK